MLEHCNAASVLLIIEIPALRGSGRSFSADQEVLRRAIESESDSALSIYQLSADFDT